jgi:flagellar biosynthesis chaperone FliJ
VRRFRWPLQRLLEVTRQRELAQRAELLGVSREMARVRHEIARRRRIIRASLIELSKKQLPARMLQQEVVMVCSASREREIKQLNEQLKDLERQRKEKTARLIKTKNSRETLEKMRERARQAHWRQQLKVEQKELDEVAHVSFAHRSRKDPAVREPAGGRHD